ncbi:MAG: LysR family transcriptional regulator [Paucibacter sp.]|nr:LysR family transcriptional regulator [Roseateles sp.]
MEWSDVRLFLAIARNGSLGAAARTVGLTQPTMGRRLRALEASLGHTLFQRSNAGFVLTDEGSAVLTRAERMEDEALALERELAGGGQSLEGLLRISSSDWFGTHVLAPVLARFVDVHPRVSLELITDARLYDLSRREADLVFRIQPFDEPEVMQRRLMNVAYGLYAARGSKKIKKGSKGSGLSIVTLDAAYRDFPDVRWLREKLPEARVSISSNNRSAQAVLCAAGAGLAVLPRLLGDAMDALELVNLGEAPPARPVWMGYHRDLRRQARLRALIESVVDELADDKH